MPRFGVWGVSPKLGRPRHPASRRLGLKADRSAERSTRGRSGQGVGGIQKQGQQKLLLMVRRGPVNTRECLALPGPGRWRSKNQTGPRSGIRCRAPKRSSIDESIASIHRSPRLGANRDGSKTCPEQKPVPAALDDDLVLGAKLIINLFLTGAGGAQHILSGFRLCIASS